jgi:pyrimidine 5'-nucleotidase
MSFTTLLFDVDDTLYPSHSGLWDAIRDRMMAYLSTRFSPDQIDRFRDEYYLQYGTTLRGLMINHPDRIDPQEYLAQVHDVPLQKFIQPNPGLREMLQTIPQRRWIFTNADAAHARRVMRTLGVSDCFDGIVDIIALEFSCKPMAAAYLKTLDLVGERDPRRCVLLDDSPRNLAPARDLGLFTVRVGSTQPDPSACLSIASLSDLPAALPELWFPNGEKPT